MKQSLLKSYHWGVQPFNFHSHSLLCVHLCNFYFKLTFLSKNCTIFFFHSSFVKTQAKTFFSTHNLKLGLIKVKGKTDFFSFVFRFSLSVCVYFSFSHSSSPVLSMWNSVFYCQIKTHTQWVKTRISVPLLHLVITCRQTAFVF
jgi:hypothetical protein